MKNSQNWTKIVKETLFSEGFLNLIQFALNLSTPTHQSGLQLGLPNFWHPWHPWHHQLLQTFHISRMCGKIKKSNVLHSFVNFPMRKTIFGSRGCFSASLGLKMNIDSLARPSASWGYQIFHFLPMWGRKTTSHTKNYFPHRENDKWMK